MASGIDVNTMIIELREHLGVADTDPDWTDTDCLLILNRSFWELLNKFNFKEKEASEDIQTVVGQDTYTMPIMFESIQSVGVQDYYTEQYHKLRRIGVNLIQDELNTETFLQAIPTQYYRRDTYDVTFWPIPDKIYNVRIYYLINLQDLADNEDIDIPREWHELILLGGVWRGYFKVGDMDRANLTKDFQANLIDSTVPVESKEEIDSSNAPGLGLERYRQRRLWR